MNDDERQARIAEIKHRHRTVTENVVWAGICVTCDEQEPCDAMTLLAELDAATARAERAEASLLAVGVPLINDVVCWCQESRDMRQGHADTCLQARAALAEGA